MNCDRKPNRPKLLKYARELRKRQTFAENALWICLRNRQLFNLKFRRQHRIGFYIVDFYCHEKKLVIELDGVVHEDCWQIKKDKIKDAYLIATGNKILRFKNDEIFQNFEKVMRKIYEAVVCCEHEEIC